MKGKQLTLEEVLNLEDGSMVWVEELSGLIDSNLYEINKEHERMYTEYDKFYRLDDLETMDDINFYEWIKEEQKEIISTYKSISEIIESMIVEICNLRGLDLTDDNIDKIMKEFGGE